nr:DUF4937 domain-containing protein [Shewanella aquimarina]
MVSCQVELGQEFKFSQGQLLWNELNHCAGFRGQFGGWVPSKQQAIIIGLWESSDAVNLFMESVHDGIYIRSDQGSTYKQCDVHYFEGVLSIPSLTNKLTQPTDPVIRIAFCRGVKDVERFLADQREIWNEKMGHAEGMLCGYVARSLKQHDYFIVITQWSSKACHEHYVKTIFPLIKLAVSPSDYIESLSGCLVEEELTWKVSPNK